MPSAAPPRRRAAEAKSVALDLDRLFDLDGEVRGLKSRVDELRRQRNEISDGFKSADPSERPAPGPRRSAPKRARWNAR
jgi:seryl-tRNA synthetase